MSEQLGLKEGRCTVWLYAADILFVVEENSRTIMKKAARAVDSLSDTEFNITFNPDLFQPHVVHAQPEVRAAGGVV